MNLALNIRGEDWWPFPEETVTDLLRFLDDGEGFAEPAPLAIPAPAANDNWPFHMESSRINELPRPVIWSPRFRTAD